jgi:IMP dehydrogenase
MYLSYDDFLIEPQFNAIPSRREVDLSVQFANVRLRVPFVSSNMDTVTNYKMAGRMAVLGGIGALHRFCTVEKNVEMFEKAVEYVLKYKEQEDNYTILPMVSIGLGAAEVNRAKQLVSAGANCIIIDVAHGASLSVCQQYDNLRAQFGSGVSIIVGNFATKKSIQEFNTHIQSLRKPDAYKLNVGSGSVCSTRIVTGCGLPGMSSILDCASLGVPLIADGGIRNSGDIAKAIAAGATAVMCGQLFAATSEAPGKKCRLKKYGKKVFKKYRGSASYESYKLQGKLANHRTPEGESGWLHFKGPVKPIVMSLESGLRSALTYVGAKDIMEFKKKANLVQISNYSVQENFPHAKVVKL